MRYRSYRYTSYSKTVFDLALDSAIVNDPDAWRRWIATRKDLCISQKQHLLLIESATKKSFIPRPVRAKKYSPCG